MRTTNCPKKNILEIDIKNYSQCDWASDNKDILLVPWKFYSIWLYLMRIFYNSEWGGVFWVEDNKIIDFKIPKQIKSSSMVEFLEDLGGNGIVHSHHSMGAFHSSQDDKEARNLYEWSIVLSHDACIASKKIKLPCDAFGYINVELEIIDMPLIDIDKIQEKKPAYKMYDYKINDYDYYCDNYLNNNQRKNKKKQDKIETIKTTEIDNNHFEDNFDLDDFCIKCTDFNCLECLYNDTNIPNPFCWYCDHYYDEDKICNEYNNCHKMRKFLKRYPHLKRNLFE